MVICCMKGSSTLIASVTIGWVARVRRLRLMCLVVGGCDWDLGWFTILLDCLFCSVRPARNLGLFYVAQQPLVGQVLFIIGASLSYSETPHSVGVLWANDKSDAETST